MATSQQNGSAARRALWITDLIRLAGIVIAVHEALTSRDPGVFVIASFMLAGAQGGENVIKKVASK